MLQPPLAAPGPAPRGRRHALAARGNPRYRQAPAGPRQAPAPPHGPTAAPGGGDMDPTTTTGNTSAPPPTRRGAPNAFRAAFLARLDERDEPGSAAEAES